MTDKYDEFLWNELSKSLVNSNKDVVVSEVQRLGASVSPILIEAMANNYPMLSPGAICDAIESMTREIGNQLNAGSTLAFISKSEEGVEITAFNITPKKNMNFVLPQLPANSSWKINPTSLQKINLDNED